MRLLIRGLLLGATAAVAAAPAPAQVCAGLPSLHERPVIVSLDGGRSKTGSSVDLGITAGRSMFGAVAYGATNYQDISFAAQTLDASSTTYGALLGYEWALAASQHTPGARIGVCPVLSFGYETGPDADAGGTTLDSDGWTMTGGISVGGVLIDRRSWRLLPFAAASFAHVAATVHDVPFPGTDTEASDNGWVFAFGAGIGIGRRVTISPGYNIPASIEGGENSFTLSINVGFGTASR